MARAGWRIPPFGAKADRETMEQLWRKAMPPSWPVLPAGVELLGAGLGAEAGLVPGGAPPSIQRGASR
jgi:hypothetical protein